MVLMDVSDNYGAEVVAASGNRSPDIALGAHSIQASTRLHGEVFFIQANP
jgi:hypothetical protein